MMNPFTPGASTLLEVTDTTANVALPAGGGMQVLIFAPAANDTVFIQFGTDNTVEAEVTDIAIPPGFNRIFTIPPNATYVAGIAASTETGDVYITRGDGQ